MTIDERLEALTARHEALAQSLELMQLAQNDTGEKIKQLAVIAEQNEVRAGKMIDGIRSLTRGMDRHEKRIRDLEGNR